MTSLKQIEANRKNAMSPNIGKRGLATHTMEIVEAKKFWINKVHDNLLTIFEALYNKAITGDTMAIKELLDRSWGKAVQGVEMSGKDGNPIVFMPLELIQKHALQVANDVVKEEEPLHIDAKVVQSDNEKEV